VRGENVLKVFLKVLGKTRPRPSFLGDKLAVVSGVSLAASDWPRNAREQPNTGGKM
jgi:hypothetical protein